MAHRGIVTLALASMLSFLLLSHFDPQFFLIHFYESLIYIVIVLLLFYFEDRWAYMLGILAPASWLLLTYLSGGFGGFLFELGRAMHFERASYPANLVGAIAAGLSILMVLFCGYRWRRTYAGLGKWWSTFGISLVVVVIYYGLLVLFIVR